MTAAVLYRGLTEAAAPLIALLLRRRLARGREDAARFRERLGIAGRARPSGPLVWVHAASVGESLSVLGLVERIRVDWPRTAVLVTTGTVTSAHLMGERLPAGAFHQYLPVDRVRYARRFLDHWRPDLALWVESDLWPNIVGAAQARNIPMVLVNARMSPSSAARWRLLPGLIGRLLGGFRLCLAQNDGQAETFAALGAETVRSRGNLKYAAEPLGAETADIAALRAGLGDRPRWLAASTHPGEEELIAAAHRTLRNRFPDLLTILVPRHPGRGAAIAARLRADGFTVARRAAGETPADGTDIYLADTLGELGLFYRAAGIVFVGGSLVPHGGQNPLEPARLDCAVLHGPHMQNFREIADEFAEAGASAAVAAETLADAVTDLLLDPGRRDAMAAAGHRIATGKAGILDAVLADLRPFLEPLGRDAAPPPVART